MCTGNTGKGLISGLLREMNKEIDSNLMFIEKSRRLTKWFNIIIDHNHIGLKIKRFG